MRQYGQIQCAVWGHPDFLSLSDGGKLLFTYILTGEHSNGLGCYRLPLQYVQADLGWSSETVSKRFGELFQTGFVNYCKETNFVFIPKFLKWNPISNKNTAKAREKEFNQIPTKMTYMPELAGDVEKYGNHFSNGFETVLKGFRKGFRRDSETGSKQEPNPTQPNPTEISGKPDAPSKEKLVGILDFLNAKAKRDFRPVETNLDLIRSRLSEGYTEDDLKNVIVSRCAKWLGDPKMSEYLRPTTIFGKEKFSQYVGEAGETSEEWDEVFGGAV